MKIVASALHFAWDDVAGCLRRASTELGLDGVEFSWHRSFQRGHCTLRDMDELTALKGQGAVITAHVWGDLASADGEGVFREMAQWLDLAERVGAAELVCHGGRATDRLAGMERVRRILERLEPLCSSRGVFLNVENHYPYEYRSCSELLSDSWEFVSVLSGLGRRIGFCLDTGHANMAGNMKLMIACLGPWLRYVHIADNGGVDDDHLPYGCGTIDWPGFWDSLRKVGFDGTVCMEFPIDADCGMASLKKCRMDAMRYAAGLPQSSLV